MQHPSVSTPDDESRSRAGGAASRGLGPARGLLLALALGAALWGAIIAGALAIFRYVL